MALTVKPNITRSRDLDLNFNTHPVTGDVTMKIGDNAVIASVKNLIMTGFYERPFHSELGSGVRQMLFENADPMTAQSLKKAIIEVIENFEPRVSIKDVVVQIPSDQNVLQVIMEFYIVNNAESTVVDFFLERVR